LMRMLQRLRGSLRGKVTALVIVTTLAALIVTAIPLVYYSVRDYRQRKLADVRTLAEIVARASVPALVFNDQKEAMRDLELVRNRPGLGEGALYDDDGSLFAYFVRGDSGSDVPISPRKAGEYIQGRYLTIVY